ncbi:MAG: phosphotransferase [Myxococcota bacterium]
MEWDAEWEVTDALARALIDPLVSVRELARFGEGWDNVAYRVNHTWVFRFPRRSIAVPLLEVEARVLPQLPPLPLPIPRPAFVGKPSEAFPHPFVGYRMLPGATACTLTLSRVERALFAAPLAEFLKALHAALPIRGLPGDEFGRMDIAKRLEQASERFRELIDEGHLRSLEPWEASLADAPVDYTPRSDALCHGDLYERHLLVEDGRLSGVIDWGDVHQGDPAVDLSLAHRLLPSDSLDAFRHAYGDVPEATWRAARFRALHHSVACLRYAIAEGDCDLERTTRWALQNLAE